MATQREALKAVQAIDRGRFHLGELVEQIRSPAGVIPFVGAGLSKPNGFPLWKEFLVEQAKRAPEGGVAAIRDHLEKGAFEEAAGYLAKNLGPRDFNDTIAFTFGDQALPRGRMKGPVRELPALTPGPVVTTNLDHVLENSFAEQDRRFSRRVLGGRAQQATNAFTRNARHLLKIHGDVDESEDRVITLDEYTRAYGDPDPLKVDFEKPLPSLLKRILGGDRSLLFLGCSLDKDRTVAALRKLMTHDDGIVHYAIVERPSEEAAFRSRLRELSYMGIRPIWYPPGKHELIEPLLRHLAKQAHTKKAAGKPSAAGGKRSRANVLKDFYGKDVEAGSRALSELIGRGKREVPRIVDLIARIDRDWSETRRVQVLYRCKRYFAAFPKEAAEPLRRMLKDPDWNVAHDAAECFELFSDRRIKKAIAGRIAGHLLELDSHNVLDHPEPVRTSIRALGALGAFEQGSVIFKVLERVSEEPTKLSNFVFGPIARLVATLPVSLSSERVSKEIRILPTLFAGYESERFDRSGNFLFEENHLLAAKRELRKRRTAEKSDPFIRFVRRGQSRGSSRAHQLARECYAHLLGGLGLTRATPRLVEILLAEDEPAALRAECALALGRSGRPEAAQALREAADPGRSDLAPFVYWSLARLAHLRPGAKGAQSDLDLALAFFRDKGATPPELVRAVGLSGRPELADLLDPWLTDDNDEVRGQAGLALARLRGESSLSRLRDLLGQVDSDLERILFAVAILEAGRRPRITLIRQSLDRGAAKWPYWVVEDVLAILERTGDAFKKLAGHWRAVLETLPPGLSEIDRAVGSLRQQ